MTTPSELVVSALSGEGAYTGLSALLSPTASSYPTTTLAGAIFSGSLPPR